MRATLGDNGRVSGAAGGGCWASLRRTQPRMFEDRLVDPSLTIRRGENISEGRVGQGINMRAVPF